MALILNIETSVNVCSINIASNGECLLELTAGIKNDHISQLTILIGEVIKKTNSSLDLIEAVAISSGPGSYTGLRIGVSVAKGICHALKKPLIAINTLDSMAEAAIPLFQGDLLFCPLIDARRMEVYTVIIDRHHYRKLSQQSIVLVEHLFDELLGKHKIVFFGSGLVKGKTFLQHENAMFYDEHVQSSLNMVKLSESKFLSAQFEDLSYFEPDYAKAFYTVKK